MNDGLVATASCQQIGYQPTRHGSNLIGGGSRKDEQLTPSLAIQQMLFGREQSQRTIIVSARAWTGLTSNPRKPLVLRHGLRSRGRRDRRIPAFVDRRRVSVPRSCCCVRVDVPDTGNHTCVPRLAYVVYVTRIVRVLVLNSRFERDDVCFDTGSHSEVQVKGRQTN